MADTKDKAAQGASKVSREQWLASIGGEQMIRETPRPGIEAAWLGEAKRLYRRFGHLLSVLSHREPESPIQIVEDEAEEAERELSAMTSTLLTKADRQGLANKELLLFLTSVDRAAKHRIAPQKPGRLPPILPPSNLKGIVVTLTTRRSIRERLGHEGKRLRHLIERWVDDTPDGNRPSKYGLAAKLWNDVGGATARGKPWTQASVKKLWTTRRE